MPADISMTPETVLRDHAAGAAVSRSGARMLVDAVLDATLSLDRFATWLEATADRPPTAAEIAGVADALRGRMLPVRSPRAVIGDTCGTGGDGSGTFNISTAAAIVVAAAGLPVAKHGNRAVSSRTGSADVLESLGVAIAPSPPVVERCLSEIGLAFVFAPAHHPALAAVRDLRRSIGRPTVFNLVGPLCNPAGATVQVIGVGRDDARRPLAEAARMLGLTRAVIVRSEDGVDELSLFAPTHVLDVSSDGISEASWRPEDFGIATAAAAGRDSLRAADSAESAECIRSVLEGIPGPRRDIVILNAAALLWAAGLSAELPAAAQRAAAAIDSGRSLDMLARLQTASHSQPGESCSHP
ncbi:MAG: anthranilate phosphoribosyltransferase [Planctomycetia bacterium]